MLNFFQFFLGLTLTRYKTTDFQKLVAYPNNFYKKIVLCPNPDEVTRIDGT